MNRSTAGVEISKFEVESSGNNTERDQVVFPFLETGARKQFRRNVGGSNDGFSKGDDEEARYSLGVKFDVQGDVARVSEKQAKHGKQVESEERNENKRSSDLENDSHPPESGKRSER